MTTETKAAPPGRIMLKNVRIAFPMLFEPKPFNDGKPMFGAAFILPPNHPQVAEIKAKMKVVADAQWRPPSKVYQSIIAADRTALHDGNTKAQYDGYEGNLFINANAKPSAKPTTLNAAREPVGDDGTIYAGCYVNASLEFWAQNNKWGQRVNAQLRGVQFFADGDAFAAGPPPAGEDEFDAADGTEASDFG